MTPRTARRGRTVVLLSALGVLLTSAPDAVAQQGPAGSGAFGTPAQAPPSTTVTLTDTANGGDTGYVRPAGAGRGPSNGRRYEYRTIEVQGPCPVTPTEPNPRLVRYERRELPDGAWTAYGGGCTGQVQAAAAPVLDLADIYNTAVTVRASVTAVRPDLAVQPAGGALINQPAIFYVTDPGQPPTASATNPLSGRLVTVTLTTPTYTWDFGDGAGRRDLAARGQAYSSRAAVAREGNGEPYISHTYSQPRSTKVTVTATYGVNYTFTGNTEGPLALEPLSVSDDAPLRVVAARADLVSR